MEQQLNNNQNKEKKADNCQNSVKGTTMNSAQISFLKKKGCEIWYKGIEKK